MTTEPEKDRPHAPPAEEQATEPAELAVVKYSARQTLIVTIITAVTSVLVTLLSTGVLSRRDDPSPSSPRTELDTSRPSFQEFRTASGDTVDIGTLVNRGLEVRVVDTTMDLSSRVAVDPDERDLCRMSPGIQTTEVEFVRLNDSAHFFVHRFASQRSLNDIACLTHRTFDVAYFPKSEVPEDQRVGGLEHYWYLIVDIREHIIDIPQMLRFRSVRWNAFQSENDNYFGHAVLNKEKESRLRVVLPYDRALAGDTKFTVETMGEVKERTPYVPAAVDTTTSARFVTWRIPDPIPDRVYKVHLDWKAVEPELRLTP